MQQFNHVKTELQELSTHVTKLRSSISRLKETIPNVQRYTEEVQRDIKKWQFKTQPRLNRIQIILDVLKIDQKSK